MEDSRTSLPRSEESLIELPYQQVDPSSTELFKNTSNF